ncbi:IS3 family transposase [Pseudarthrobacter sp. alpha12b]
MAEEARRRDVLLGVITALSGVGYGVRRACSLLGLSHETWYRYRRGTKRPGVVVAHRDRSYPNRISPEDEEKLLQTINNEEYSGLSVTQAVRRMADAGDIYCSMASAHRIVRRHGQNGDRRRRRSAGAATTSRAKPVLQATAPNQLWSWDITMLRGPGRQHLKLYTIIDVFSRKVMGHRVEQVEDTALAQDLIRSAVLAARTAPKVLHADNGGPMRSARTWELLRTLGIRPSHSRPRVSNDNPYIESLFKTVKYSLEFPERFESLKQARDFARWFFDDYNNNHLHSGLNWFTPTSVHDGSAADIRNHRQHAHEAYYRRHPERFRSPPVTPAPPGEAWINQPNQTPKLSQTA